MHSVALTHGESIPSPIRRVGRPRGSFSGETVREEIQGAAFGVVAACSDGIEHLGIARALDQQGDVLVALLERQLGESLELLREGQLRRAEGMIKGATFTLAQIRAADEMEESHWNREAPLHVGEARAEGRAIAAMCDLPHLVN